MSSLLLHQEFVDENHKVVEQSSKHFDELSKGLQTYIAVFEKQSVSVHITTRISIVLLSLGLAFLILVFRLFFIMALGHNISVDVSTGKASNEAILPVLQIGQIMLVSNVCVLGISLFLGYMLGRLQDHYKYSNYMSREVVRQFFFNVQIASQMLEKGNLSEDQKHLLGELLNKSDSVIDGDKELRDLANRYSLTKGIG
jgi:hypothetical protein